MSPCAAAPRAGAAAASPSAPSPHCASLRRAAHHPHHTHHAHVLIHIHRHRTQPPHHILQRLLRRPPAARAATRMAPPRTGPSPGSKVRTPRGTRPPPRAASAAVDAARAGGVGRARAVGGQGAGCGRVRARAGAGRTAGGPSPERGRGRTMAAHRAARAVSSSPRKLPAAAAERLRSGHRARQGPHALLVLVGVRRWAGSGEEAHGRECPWRAAARRGCGRRGGPGGTKIESSPGMRLRGRSAAAAACSGARRGQRSNRKYDPRTRPFLHVFASIAAAAVAAIHTRRITHLSKAGVSTRTRKLPRTAHTNLAQPVLRIMEHLALALTLALAAVVLVVLEPVRGDVLGHRGRHRPAHEAPAHALGGVPPLEGMRPWRARRRGRGQRWQ